MAATVFDLVGDYAIEKGFPWSLGFTRTTLPGKTPVDLTGCHARLEIYDTQNPGAAPLVFSDQSGHVTLGGPTGTFKCRLEAAETLAIAATAARYRLIFTDSLGDDQLYWRGRLGFLEVDQ